jgi:hypothetical protein
MINEKHVFKSGGGSDRSSQLPLCPAAGVVEGLHAKFEIKKKKPVEAASDHQVKPSARDRKRKQPSG